MGKNVTQKLIESHLVEGRMAGSLINLVRQKSHNLEYP